MRKRTLAAHVLSQSEHAINNSHNIRGYRRTVAQRRAEIDAVVNPRAVLADGTPLLRKIAQMPSENWNISPVIADAQS